MSTDDGDSGAGPVGVGFNVDVDRFGCAVGVGDSARMVSGADGSTVPLALAVSADGVLVGDEATDPPEDAPVVRPLPQFGPEGANDGPVKKPARAELPLTRFLREGLPEWRRNAEAVLDDESPSGIERAFEVPVVGIPGGYTDDDAAQIRRVAANAGIRIGEFVRAPLGTAAAHAPELSASASDEAADDLLAAVHVDEYWCNVAFLSVDSNPLTMTVHARTAIPDNGRTAFVDEIAEWILDRYATERDVDVSVTPEGRSAVRSAVERGIERSDGHAIEVSLEDEDGIEADGSPVSFQYTVDASDGYGPLNDAIERIVERFETLRHDRGFDRDAFETVLLTGSGAHVPTVRRAVGSYFGTEPQDPARGTTDTAPAIGAAILAGAARSGESVRVEDAFREDVGVELLDGTDLEYETVASHARPRRDEPTVDLAPVRETQVQGQVPLVTRHPATGAVTDRRILHVTGLPGDDGETVEVTLWPDGDEYRVSARLKDAGDAADLVEAKLVSDPLPEVPPLRAPGVDVERSAASDAFGDREYGSSVDDVDVHDDVSTDRVIKESVEVRNSLWQAAEAADRIEPEDVDALRRRIDNALGRAGVSLIDPDVGAEAVGGRHEVRAIREADRPQGTIVDVLAPGYEVDGRVGREAQVVVSDGSGTTDGESASADSDARTGEPLDERTAEDSSPAADDRNAAADGQRQAETAAEGRSRAPGPGAPPVSEPPEDGDEE